MRLFLLGHVQFLGNKVLVGPQVDALVFQIHGSSLYHHNIENGGRNMVDGNGFMSMDEGPTMASPTSLNSPLLSSSAGTLLFLKRVLLSSIMPALVRMCLPGAIRSVRLHCGVGLVRLLGM